MSARLSPSDWNLLPKYFVVNWITFAEHFGFGLLGYFANGFARLFVCSGAVPFSNFLRECVRVICDLRLLAVLYPGPQNQHLQTSSGSAINSSLGQWLLLFQKSLMISSCISLCFERAFGLPWIFHSSGWPIHHSTRYHLGSRESCMDRWGVWECFSNIYLIWVALEHIHMWYICKVTYVTILIY